jgi:phosphatidylserine/phosphatidylglycerophosphate/cardiolipin synthase-like enzyme
MRRFILVACALALAACAASPPERRAESARIVAAARPTEVDRTALQQVRAAPAAAHLAARALAESSSGQPRHYAVILDQGPDAMLARINLIRAATTRIDLQTYIFDETTPASSCSTS